MALILHKLLKLADMQWLASRLQRSKSVSLILIALTIAISGCSSLMRDRAPRIEHPIRSIVVLPPLNRSTEVNAPYIYLSTITKPLAENGYYVFPVAIVDALMKQNGLPTPAEMHAVPLDKIREHIGADAVLYVTIDDWGQKFRIVDSRAVVRANLRLVETKTGATIWRGLASAESGGNSDNVNGFQEKLVAAVVGQIIGSLIDSTRELARTANERALELDSGGLAPGPYRKLN